MNKRPHIFLTNDDGIHSPGIWAAAQELSKLGYVTVAAPREQNSGAGRSVPSTSDGKIEEVQLKIGEQEWTCYAVGGSPAQVVQYGVFMILKEPPDLVVSAINYGENPAIDITMSGTVGAALEGASRGIPSLAVSIQLENEDYLGYSKDVDFTTAAVFTRRFAKVLLEKKMPEDVNVLNINVPSDANPDTGWRITRLSRQPYFKAYLRETSRPDKPWTVDARPDPDPEELADPTTDAATFKKDRLVSVTPLSLDMTSRVHLPDLQTLIGNLD